jgi:hypothetical protein
MSFASEELLAFSSRTADVNASMFAAIIRISGLDYPAAVPEPRVIPSLITGGEIMEGSLVARVKITDMATAPAENIGLLWKRPTDTTWKPETWWIQDVSRSPIDSEWVIRCGPKN